MARTAAVARLGGARLAHHPHDGGAALRASLLAAEDRRESTDGERAAENEPHGGLEFPGTTSPAATTSSIFAASSA